VTGKLLSWFSAVFAHEILIRYEKCSLLAFLSCQTRRNSRGNTQSIRRVSEATDRESGPTLMCFIRSAILVTALSGRCDLRFRCVHRSHSARQIVRIGITAQLFSGAGGQFRDVYEFGKNARQKQILRGGSRHKRFGRYWAISDKRKERQPVPYKAASSLQRLHPNAKALKHLGHGGTGAHAHFSGSQAIESGGRACPFLPPDVPAEIGPPTPGGALLHTPPQRTDEISR